MQLEGCSEAGGVYKWTQEDIEETQEAGREPIQEVETPNNVMVQEQEDVEPALLYRAEFVNDNKVKSAEEIKHLPHEMYRRYIWTQTVT